MQRRATDQVELATVPPIVPDVLNSTGQPLDANTRAFMEPRFGHDFSSVRVYTDAKAAESARAVNALAYTVGRDVVFGAGQYAPGTIEGQRLIAHELTHTIQQVPVAQAGLENLRIADPSAATEREAMRAAGTIVQARPWIVARRGKPELAREAAPTVSATLQALQIDFGNCPEDWRNKLKAAIQLAQEMVHKALASIDLLLNSLKLKHVDTSNTAMIDAYLQVSFHLGREVTKANASQELVNKSEQNSTVTTTRPVLREDVLAEILAIRQSYRRIQAAFKGRLPFKCDSKCGKVKGREMEGYVKTSLFWFLRTMHDIHACPPWYALTPLEQAAMIIHEMAHKYAHKEDEAYEFEKDDFGKLSPKAAINNADSYSLFAKLIYQIT